MMAMRGSVKLRAEGQRGAELMMAGYRAMLECRETQASRVIEADGGAVSRSRVASRCIQAMSWACKMEEGA